MKDGKSVCTKFGALQTRATRSTSTRRSDHSRRIAVVGTNQNTGIGARPILQFSSKNPFAINESAVCNPTGLKPAYTASVSCREADVDNSVQFKRCGLNVMRKKLARAGAAVSRRTKKLERSSWSVVIQLHIDRERKLGAKSARHTQRRKDRSRGNLARRGVSADLSFAASVIEAAGPCLSNAWPAVVR